ncbi:peroxiredoxin-like 2C isoform X1 [Ictalurus furcatus]|uniref:peroxiredoxin-like 2C isoform X1 n=1 Tax=Ictalurus furcatus TaxID=66913 RepID=UPI0023501FB3|nr:peroxiredoxin-like 2C isoform X1 [Ictalurus furcatus]
MHAINSRGLALGSGKLHTEGEMATGLPITQQICSSVPPTSSATSAVPIAEVEDCLIYDRNGLRLTFKSLYQTHKAIIIFVRHFLCFTCQEYVEDLSKIPQEILLDADVRLIVIGQSGFSHIEAFCSLTGYQHEIYVDPERHIYKKLGMKRGEIYEETASQSPHVKSSMLVGSIKSMWRAMTSPAFDFQGDPLQQGGALIIGPGPNIHVAHFDMNRFNHMPINGLLQLAGMQVVDFNRHAKIIDV